MVTDGAMSDAGTWSAELLVETFTRQWPTYARDEVSRPGVETKRLTIAGCQ